MPLLVCVGIYVVMSDSNWPAIYFSLFHFVVQGLIGPPGAKGDNGADGLDGPPGIKVPHLLSIHDTIYFMHSQMSGTYLKHFCFIRA